jgi:adenine-specific DNA glycosylase
MELGQTICRVETPLCEECPLAFACVAKARKLTGSIPPKPKPKEITLVRELALAVRNAQGHVLVGKRPKDTRWAGMWEFPHEEWDADEDLRPAVIRIARETLGISVHPELEVSTVKHAVTNFEITMELWECRLEDGAVESEFFEEWKWVAPKELKKLAAGTAQHQLFAAYAHPSRQLKLN